MLDMLHKITLLRKAIPVHKRAAHTIAHCLGTDQVIHPPMLLMMRLCSLPGYEVRIPNH